MKLVIGIDAGHGGRNRGTSHPESGLFEPELTLDVAARAAGKLSWSPFVQPVLIREEDIHLKLNERYGIAERAGCSAVVSVHFNASASRGRDGGEIYHRRGDSAGRALGVEIFAALPGRDWRTWRSDYKHEGKIASEGAFNITTAFKMPCALCEFAFLSNAQDRAWLLRDGTLDQIAQAIADGCEAWAKQQTQETP